MKERRHGLSALLLALFLVLTLCACGQTDEPVPPEEPDQSDTQDETIPEDDGKGDLIPEEEAAPAASTTTTSTTTVIQHSTPAPKQEGRGNVIYDDGSRDSYLLTEDDEYEEYYDDGWGDYIEDDYDYSYDDEGWGDYVDDDGWGDYADEEGWGDIF